ncbi:hypothetical protein [Luteolibacter sp. Populi]|uniref:hypothetical protein n=1 Tax=Luteolibacter sp. Populi TaxID=3230487 RepID=UPI003465A64F
MTLLAITCRLLPLAALLSLASSCQPLGGSDPLDTAQGSAATLPPLTSDPDKLRDERVHADHHQQAVESNQGNSFHGSVGASTSAEF